MRHSNSIDLKSFRVPYTWTTVDVLVAVTVSLTIGILLGAQFVKWDMAREISKIESADTYQAALDTEAPMHAAKSRAINVRTITSRPKGINSRSSQRTSTDSEERGTYITNTYGQKFAGPSTPHPPADY